MRRIKELYEYRQMIFSLVKKDLRGRYKGSFFGFFWTFLNPLLQLLVYTIVFSVILKNDIDRYYLHLFVALVPWLFFSSSLTDGANSIIREKNMVKKIYFPREVLPISAVTTNFINMLFSFIVIFAVILFTGSGINFSAVLLLPIIMIVQYFLVLGIAMITSCISVYVRDLIHILGIVSMLWMYLTPVVYKAEQIPEKYRFIFSLNPMTSIIVAYRDILYHKKTPDISTLVSGVVFGVVALLIGWVIFDKLQRGFAEEL